MTLSRWLECVAGRGGQEEDLWVSLVWGPGWVACSPELCVHDHVQVLFGFHSLHFASFLLEFWDPEPQLGRKGCSMIASYTGQTYPLQLNVLWGLQLDACAANFISGRRGSSAREKLGRKKEVWKRGERWNRKTEKEWGECLFIAFMAYIFLSSRCNKLMNLKDCSTFSMGSNGFWILIQLRWVT